MAFHLRGIVVPDDQERDLYVVGDRLTLEPLARAETVVDGGWLLPGLVDVHTHPGAEHPGDPLDEALLRRHASQHRDAGVTLLRVPGSAARLPAWFGQDDQLPRVYGAGPWLAAKGRFFPGWGRQVELAALPEVAVEEAKASGGWCKVIADWSVGEGAERRYGPSVPPEVLAEVVRQVHAAGGEGGGPQPAPRGVRRRGGGRRGFPGARHAPGDRAAGHHGTAGDRAGADDDCLCGHP